MKQEGKYFEKMKFVQKIKENGICRSIKDVLNVLIINQYNFNWRMRILKKDMSDYQLLKKKYSNILKEISWNKENLEPVPKRIWICWFQGEENAPDIVKICIASVRKNFSEYNIVVITEKNISEYIEIPQYIKEKRDKGLIKSAHYSDIVRLKLLNQYGGIWLDSTVLCTSKNFLDGLIKEGTRLFVYQDFKALDPYVGMSNWCILSCPQNPYLVSVEKLLLRYWETHKKVENYFIFHLFFMLIAEYKPEEWKKIPTYSCQPPHIMQDELFDMYDETRYKQILKMTDVHKLSYKFEKSEFERKETIYKYLENHFLIKGKE